ncbi:MAG: hypothetical protein L0Y66_19970 [Myxococcaceae bacterium]|nr:hypothetical protein [Myxococcaceae bacterium]
MVPVGHGYVEAGASLTRLTGPRAYLEAGYHPLAPLALYAQAFAAPEDSGLLAGARFTF